MKSRQAEDNLLKTEENVRNATLRRSSPAIVMATQDTSDRSYPTRCLWEDDDFGSVVRVEIPERQQHEECLSRAFIVVHKQIKTQRGRLKPEKIKQNSKEIK